MVYTSLATGVAVSLHLIYSKYVNIIMFIVAFRANIDVWYTMEHLFIALYVQDMNTKYFSSMGHHHGSLDTQYNSLSVAGGRGRVNLVIHIGLSTSPVSNAFQL